MDLIDIPLSDNAWITFAGCAFYFYIFYNFALHTRVNP